MLDLPISGEAAPFMSRIFLSHSAKDDFAAVALRDWLNENGWDDVFLDLDPVQGIQPGQRWEQELNEHASRCQAVVFLVSHNWLASEWCRREHELARKLNKRIFVVLIDDMTIEELPAYLTQTYQVVALAAGTDHRVFRVILPGTHQEGHVTFSNEALARLKSGLEQAGLDARFFAWPPPNEPNRAPYRGLEPLESVDAGIFFGRDAPIIDALDSLRGLRESARPRLFIILGASGAGKSSFLRAGILPRLARDDRYFLPLIPIRPERAAITGANGLVAAIATACIEKGLPFSRAQLRDAVLSGADALRPFVRALTARAMIDTSSPKPPTLVIAIDQAEELFRAEGTKEGEDILALLRDLVSADDPAVIVLFVIRSDSYDALEHAKALEGLSQKAFPLLPMPRGAYQTVIEGPVQCLVRAGRKFEIDPSLIQSLLADIENGGGSDALPLLAFTLEQLFSDHEAAGKLTRQDYESYGGLKGAIDAAVSRAFAAADRDARIPADHGARLALLRRGLVPWLAGIDPETKTPRRRRAPATQIPVEARPLIDLLVEQRLLTRAVDDATREATLEPAHEALLRQWGSLKGWLDEDFARLVTLEDVQRAAREWDANARNSAWAAHGGARLEEAVRLDTRPDLAALLTATDRSYLAACQEKQSQAQARELALAAAERRAAQRTRVGLLVSSVLAVLAIGAAIYGFRQAQDTQQQTVIAKQKSDIAEQQSAIAEQQKAIAEQGKVEAQQQTLKAEQRSAVLAASVSESFTEEGSLDQALLLMLDASHAFDDNSVPDEIRIALTKALEKTEKIGTRQLFPNMQIFEVDGALLLFDPATKNIWKLTDSIDPKKFVAGSPDDPAIINLQQSADGKDYIVVRENLNVERIDATSGARRKIGAFSPPSQVAGEKYDFDKTIITDDGLVVRNFNVSYADPNKNKNDGDSPTLYQIMDSTTGKLLEGRLSGFNFIVGKAPGGAFYAVNGDGNILHVTSTKTGFSSQQVKVSDEDNVRLRYGDCVAKMPGPVKSAVLKEYTDEPTTGTFACKQAGNNYLIEETSHTSSGEERTDSLFRPNGKEVVVRDTLSAAVPGDISAANFAWVGLSPAASAAAADTKLERLGVLQNRNAYVLGHNPDDDSSSGDDAKEIWSPLLNYRHPAFVEYGRFIAADQLLAIDSESGQAVVHYLGDEPHQNLFPSAEDGLIGSDTPVESLQKGTCIGYSTPQMPSEVLPDGRKITFNTGSSSESSDKHELDISGTKETIIALGDDTSCVQFSADWKKLLIVNSNNVALYDFQSALNAGSLSGNQTGVIPVSGPNSAFFADPSGQTVVTANDTNRVLLWKQSAQDKSWSSSELYKGDNIIFYAEPDATGSRLILIEATGEGGAHAFLYSVGARQTWFDLGSEYKWIGATFTEKSDIAVAHGGKWTGFVPILPMSAQVTLSEKQLTPQCRPPSAGNYRQSPCWPASFQ
jgi:hypothetical protein